MKKALLILFVFILSVLSYLGWPIYQGIAYRGMAPMIGMNYVTWPSEQPTTNRVFDADFNHAANEALQSLVVQQQSVAAPGYTAAVAINGKLIWAASVGWSDISKKIQMTTDSQMRIGSTSKALTATGLARLVDSGRLNLDAPLSEYFETPPNPHWKTVTARQLASHMAGIPHYGENTETLGTLAMLGAQRYFADPLAAMALFDDSDMLFAPGEQFSYSSLGTVLLSALMQIKAEMKYQDYMQQRVFAPLAMHATFTETPTQTSDDLATFYWQDKHQPSRLKPWYHLDLSHRLAGGGWVSTSKDLAMLGQGFMNEAFISEQTRIAFWTPQRLNNGQVNPQQYGLGWRINDLDLGEGYKSVTFMHHGGVSAGAQSFLMVIPEYKLSLSVNANIRTEVFSDFASVSYDIARFFIDEIERQSHVEK
ncbi:serine hydrolase domain-containing protein [Aliiglaciecola aliphaticivorans]